MWWMYYKVLLDTNILIEREDNKILSDSLQEFSKLMNENRFEVCIHPASFEDVNNDSDKKRKEITLSKLKSYNQLINPPKFDDDDLFKEKLNLKKINDYIDGLLLYALYKDRVDFLITEDLGIHKLSKKFNLEEQVLTVDEALSDLNIKSLITPPPIEKTTVNNLDLSDPIFDSLKNDYEEFENWFTKICKEERKCLTYTENNQLGAILIYKEEFDSIYLKNKYLRSKKRIKISTMKVSSTGSKIGEFFISWIVNYAINLKCEELYLTHFVKKNDYLVYLIEEYGFNCVGENERGEKVFVKTINKKVISQKISDNNYSYSYIAKEYFPYFCDNKNVNKFIVPIKPQYHEKLFLSDNNQSKLEIFLDGGFNGYPEDLIPVNPIKKAYLTNSNVNLEEGDFLLFYETEKKGISDVGVVESFHKDVNDLNNLLKIVSKRSVFTLEELKEYAKEGASVILFIHSKRYEKKLSYEDLVKLGVINGPVQSIQSINHENYLKIKEKLE